MKRRKQIVKSGEGFIVNIRELDYRGMLALIIVFAFIVSLFVGNEDAQRSLGPLAGSAVGWWFGAKRRREAEAD